ncbi:MAG: hypothetical protein ACP5N2_05340 [Candidatus Nanoarchaeia archaeon]
MDLFMPSEKILEKICLEGEKPLVHYEIYPYGSAEEMYSNRSIYQVGLFEKIRHFYRLELDGDIDRLDIQGIQDVSGELFKNWMDHSPENSILMTGLFLGRKGIAYGYFDGGSFFKKSEIKYQVENKIDFKEFHYPDSESTCQSGFQCYVYWAADMLEVDTQKGIIYAVQLKENIIAPEGENGSDYFFEKRIKNGLSKEDG